MRIKLKENYNHPKLVDWLTKNIGPCEEGVTWFWSTNVYDYTNEYGVVCHKAEEGVEIWKDCPERLVAAMVWQ
jgi:hypothetical protein